MLPREISDQRTESGRVDLITSLDMRLQKAAVETITNAKARLKISVEKAYRDQYARNRESFDAAKDRCLAVNESDPSRCDDIFRIHAPLVAADPGSGRIHALKAVKFTCDQ